MIRHALIMAGGRGERMFPLTEAIPKAMAPFNGSTLIQQVVSRLRTTAGFVHVTVGYKKTILSGYLSDLGVSSLIDTEGKGNCWWVYHSLLRYVDEPVYVSTCDNVIDIDFQLLEDDYRAKDSPACMVVPVAAADGGGDSIVHEGPVVRAIGRDQATAFRCSGLQILNPYRVNTLTTPTENFYDLWDGLIAKKSLMVSALRPRHWLAIDTLSQLVEASAGAATFEQPATRPSQDRSLVNC